MTTSRRDESDHTSSAPAGNQDCAVERDARARRRSAHLACLEQARESGWHIDALRRNHP